MSGHVSFNCLADIVFFVLFLNPGNNCILKVVSVWWCVSLGSSCIFFNEFMRYLRVFSLEINEIFYFQACFFLNCSRKVMSPVNFFLNKVMKLSVALLLCLSSSKTLNSIL